MSGTKAGGQKARDTNLKRHGKDFYKRIGYRGGSNGTTGGFASDKRDKDGYTGRERARVAGKAGGSISRRGKSKKVLEKTKTLYN